MIFTHVGSPFNHVWSEYDTMKHWKREKMIQVICLTLFFFYGFKRRRTSSVPWSQWTRFCVIPLFLVLITFLFLATTWNKNHPIHVELTLWALKRHLNVTWRYQTLSEGRFSPAAFNMSEPEPTVLIKEPLTVIKSEKFSFTWTAWDENSFPAQSTSLITDESVEPDWISCGYEHFEMWNDDIIW